MGMGLYPQFCFLFNVSGGRIQVCGLLSRCWMVDSYIFFVFCFVRLPIVDGTGCLVWWSVKFVFRIVDGTGMFSVSRGRHCSVASGFPQLGCLCPFVAIT